MFRKDHARNLIASSKNTAFVRALVLASFCVHVRYQVPVSCGYAPSGEVLLGHRGNVAKLKIKGRCTIAVVGESTAFKVIACVTQSCACQREFLNDTSHTQKGACQASLVLSSQD